MRAMLPEQPSASQGKARWSILWGWMSATGSPTRRSSSAMAPMQTSWPQVSQDQMGMGVPQKRLREMFQSRASLIQLPKRPEPMASGTQWICLLCSTMRSRSAVTRTKRVGTAL